MNRIFATTMLATALTLAVDAGCRTMEDASGGSAPLTVKCGVALELEPADGMRTDWSGQTRVWQAVAQDDTLRLTRKGQCGDECGYTEEIILSPINAECPTHASATITRTEAGSPAGKMPRIRESGKGTVEIQDWHPTDGVVSGRVRADFELTFYVVITPPPPDE